MFTDCPGVGCDKRSGFRADLVYVNQVQSVRLVVTCSYLSLFSLVTKIWQLEFRKKNQVKGRCFPCKSDQNQIQNEWLQVIVGTTLKNSSAVPLYCARPKLLEKVSY